jgi:hypothetical protein
MTVLALALIWGMVDDPTDAMDPVFANKVRQSVVRGLDYLARMQANDGRWEADGGTYRVAMTALSALALIMDGNTPSQGKYAEQVDRAIGYLLSCVQPTGLIGKPEADARYMYGHGFSMLFLSQVLGEDPDSKRRGEIRRVLTKAVLFCGKAQTSDGGWGYLTATEGFGFDEGSVTITQLQGLRSCRNAGIVVPKEIISKGVRYIERCTKPEGVIYSLKTEGGVRPPLSAAAAACMFSAGEYDHPLASKLEKIADGHFSSGGDGEAALGHWHYAHYYYSQIAYRRGGERWKKYRLATFQKILDRQQLDGGWSDGWMGEIYTTALNLAILQLDTAALPIYQR